MKLIKKIIKMTGSYQNLLDDTELSDHVNSQHNLKKNI